MNDEKFILKLKQDTFESQIVRILSEPLTSFYMYYVANRDEWQDVIFRNGYNKFGIGGVEQYDNEGAFHEYPGETMFYHLQLIKDAINPQTKLSWFLYQSTNKGVK